MLRNAFTVVILHLNEATVLLLIRIDAAQWSNNNAIENSIEYFWMNYSSYKIWAIKISFPILHFITNLTSWQKSNILSWYTVSGHTIACCQWIFNFLTQFQMICIANEVAEVEEDFLVVFQCFNESKVVLKWKNYDNWEDIEWKFILPSKQRWILDAF